MTNIVNPPPFLSIPPAFLKDPLIRAFIEQQNTIIFQLWQKLGGNDDPISNIENLSNNSFSSQLQQLQKEINGLPKFTIDTSGFTTDLSFITTDKVIA